MPTKQATEKKPGFPKSLCALPPSRREPPAIRPVLGLYSSLYLKETLDRIHVPPLEEVPDAKTSETEKLTSWTIPYTEITIAAVKGGSRWAIPLFA